MVGKRPAGRAHPADVRQLRPPQSYGVSGQANGFSTERDTEVRSMAQIGSRMFVGGNFSRVENYTKGTHRRRRTWPRSTPPRAPGSPRSGRRSTARSTRSSSCAAACSPWVGSSPRWTAAAPGLVVLDPRRGGSPPASAPNWSGARQGTTCGTVTALGSRVLTSTWAGRSRTSPAAVRWASTSTPSGARASPPVRQARLEVEPGVQRRADLRDGVGQGRPRLLRRLLHHDGGRGRRRPFVALRTSSRGAQGRPA